MEMLRLLNGTDTNDATLNNPLLNGKYMLFLLVFNSDANCLIFGRSYCPRKRLTLPIFLLYIDKIRIVLTTW